MRSRASSSVTTKGSTACGRISRWGASSTTTAESQNGQRSAVTLGGSSTSAPQLGQRVTRLSSTSAGARRFSTAAR